VVSLAVAIVSRDVDEGPGEETSVDRHAASRRLSACIKRRNSSVALSSRPSTNPSNNRIAS
jgi:hypothetical protein